MYLVDLGLSYLKMPSVWAPPRASTYWESWTCTQGSFLSGKSSLCRSITSSRELPNREGVTMARLLWSISSKVGLRRPWRDERWRKIYYLGMSGTMILITAVSAAVPRWLGLCLCLCLWLCRSACNHVSRCDGTLGDSYPTHNFETDSSYFCHVKLTSFW